MKKKICGVYKIENTVTGDFYIGSSKDVEQRWVNHKCPSRWNDRPNSLLYKDMQEYGIDKFDFQILASVEPEHLKDIEQEFIEMLQPTYNNNRAKGWDVEKMKETKRKYRKSDKGKECSRKQARKYREKYSDKYKESQKKYCSQLCSYKGEKLTLNALATRFWRVGIEHPVLEAKKYLIKDKIN